MTSSLPNTKKRPPFNKNSVLRGAIRRAFARSPIIKEIMDESRREVPRYKKDGTRAKVDAVQRQCQVCGEWVATKLISVDHIVPVIATDDTFVDWNTYIDRVWCDKPNLQRICDPCHRIKTNSETLKRTIKREGGVLCDIAAGWVSDEFAIKFLKKFTNKRLEQRPAQMQEDILNLKARYGIKFKRKPTV